MVCDNNEILEIAEAIAKVSIFKRKRKKEVKEEGKKMEEKM